MNPDFVEQTAADAQPILREQLLTAFRSLVTTNDSRDKLDAAIQRDRAAIFNVLGIDADGKTWPRLDNELKFVLASELVPLYATVVGETWKSLGADPSESELDRTEFNTLLGDARETIARDTLEGVIQAITLVLASGLDVPDLIASIGMTAKQALIYIRATIAAMRLQSAVASETTEDGRSVILRTTLAKLPAFIANRIRRLVNDRGASMFTADDVRMFTGGMAKQFTSYRSDALASDYASKAANLSRLMVWKEAQRQSVIASDTRKYWETAGDERVRHSHEQIAAMNADGVSIGSVFQNPFGIVLTAPPAELNCRCRVVLGSPRNPTSSRPPLAGVNAS